MANKSTRNKRRNPKGPTKPWTVMVYMAADSDHKFYTAAMEDIREMTRAAKGHRINIVIHADAPQPWQTKNWEIKDNRAHELSWPTNGPSQPLHRRVRDFVQRCSELFRAEKYLLVLWGHAEGVDWTDPQANRRPSRFRLGTGVSDRERKGFGSEAEMSVADLAEGLEALTIEKDNLVLGFDACLMGMIEAYDEIRRSVGYVIAPNDELPTRGWPYDWILRKLVENPDLPPKKLCETIIYKSVASYNQENKYKAKDEKMVHVSFSACDLTRAKWEEFVIAVKTLASELAANLKNARTLDAIVRARDSAKDSGEEAYVDLHLFCSELNGSGVPTHVKKAATRVAEALKEVLILSRRTWNYPKYYKKDSRAVSICFPESDLVSSKGNRRISWSSYQKLAFSRRTDWFNFMDAFWRLRSSSVRTHNPR